METFSEFLDVAGQWHGFVSQRAAANPRLSPGAGHSPHLHPSEDARVRTGLSAPGGLERPADTQPPVTRAAAPARAGASLRPRPVLLVVRTEALGEEGTAVTPLSNGVTQALELPGGHSWKVGRAPFWFLTSGDSSEKEHGVYPSSSCLFSLF